MDVHLIRSQESIYTAGTLMAEVTKGLGYDGSGVRLEIQRPQRARQDLSRIPMFIVPVQI